MPVDFFAMPCNNPKGNCSTGSIQCLQPIKASFFGISDVNGGNGLPAKVNAVNPDPKIDFIVSNHSNTEVIFKAVDWCIPIYRTGIYNLGNDSREPVDFSSNNESDDVDLIKRCEGFLQFNESIVFIEIKNRKGGENWIKDAREKFEETILSFREHHPDLENQILKPRLCNPSFGRVHQNEIIQKRILKDKIGLEFLRENSITV